MASEEHNDLVARLVAAHDGGKIVSDVRPGDDQLPVIIEVMDKTALPIPDSVRFRSTQVGNVPGVWFHPEGADTDRVVLYFHGGGYMFGTALNTGHVTARLGRAAGVDAFSVDYRLSWQAPFPAALDDGLAAYRGLLEHGTSPGSIVLAGDSAGGGLILAMLVALRDRGEPLPAGAFASSAFTDLAVAGESARTVDDPIVTKAGLEMLASAYLDGADATEPLASPLYADLSGLPPLLIQVGSRELLLDDSTRFAERARRAGVEVTLDVLDDVVHIWQYFGPELPETRDSESRAGAFIRKVLNLTDG